MSLKGYLAKLGFTTAAAGSAAVLAFSAGSDLDASDRTGWYADITTSGSEHLGLVAGGVESARALTTGFDVFGELRATTAHGGQLWLRDSGLLYEPAAVGQNFRINRIGHSIESTTSGNNAWWTFSRTVVMRVGITSDSANHGLLSMQTNDPIHVSIDGTTVGRFLKDSLSIDVATSSTDPTTGALVVAGGVGIGGDLYAHRGTGAFGTIIQASDGGNASAALVSKATATHGGGLRLIENLGTARGAMLWMQNGILRVSTGISSATNPGTARLEVSTTQIKVIPTTASTSTTTGALVVAGGAGIGGSFYAPLDDGHTFKIGPGSGVSDNHFMVSRSGDTSQLRGHFRSRWDTTNTYGAIISHGAQGGGGGGTGQQHVRTALRAYVTQENGQGWLTAVGVEGFVQGSSWGDDRSNIGVFGRGTTTGADNETVRSIGALGVGESTGDLRRNYGGYFQAITAAGTNYGIYAEASGAAVNNYAGWFEGHTYVNDTLTVTGLIDSIGLQFDAVEANPGDALTLWVDSENADALMFGADPVVLGEVSITLPESQIAFGSDEDAITSAETLSYDPVNRIFRVHDFFIQQPEAGGIRSLWLGRGLAPGDVANVVAMGINIPDMSGAHANSIWIGNGGAGPSENWAITIGRPTEVTRLRAITIGVEGGANAQYGIAIGHSAFSTHTNSVAIGHAAVTTKANQFMLGSDEQFTEVTIPVTTDSTDTTTGALVVVGGVGIGGRVTCESISSPKGVETSQGFGAGALASNTTGANNTAIGYQALANNTTGGFNTASGIQALRSNNTGVHNTASGYQALYSNTTGIHNTASGYQALAANTTGIHNTASGFLALRYTTTGDRNTAFGYQAGRFINAGTAANAINDCVLLGNDTRVEGASDTNEIVIGSGARGNGSNTVTIGNDSIVGTHLRNVVITGALEVEAAAWTYYGDPDTDGTWRFGRDGDNTVFQRREDGSWVTKTTVEA